MRLSYADFRKAGMKEVPCGEEDGKQVRRLPMVENVLEKIKHVGKAVGVAAALGLASACYSGAAGNDQEDADIGQADETIGPDAEDAGPDDALPDIMEADETVPDIQPDDSVQPDEAEQDISPDEAGGEAETDAGEDESAVEDVSDEACEYAGVIPSCPGVRIGYSGPMVLNRGMNTPVLGYGMDYVISVPDGALFDIDCFETSAVVSSRTNAGTGVESIIEDTADGTRIRINLTSRTPLNASLSMTVESLCDPP